MRRCALFTLALIAASLAPGYDEDYVEVRFGRRPYVDPRYFDPRFDPRFVPRYDPRYDPRFFAPQPYWHWSPPPYWQLLHRERGGFFSLRLDIGRRRR